MGFCFFPSQELPNAVPSLCTFHDTQLSLCYCVTYNFHLFFWEPDCVRNVIHFLPPSKRHWNTSPSRVQVAPATWKSLALPHYSTTGPCSSRYFCLYSHNLIIHICAHSVTFCHQSFILSFLMCRVVHCLVFHHRDLAELDMYKEGHPVQRHRSSFGLTVVRQGRALQLGMWREHTEIQMVQKSWRENSCSFWDTKKQW